MGAQSKGRRIAAWVLTGLLTLLFAFSAYIKLFKPETIVEVTDKWGLTGHITLIGIGEIVSALLFLIPRTNSLGLLLLSAYMGGAIVTHMQNGEPYIIPSVVLLLVWVAGYLRHPEVLQSFRESKGTRDFHTRSDSGF
jgi:uncharacterized membrane protein YphA (DoxX/SURF4 family)